MYIYIYLYVCVCVCVYTHTYTHTHTHIYIYYWNWLGSLRKRVCMSRPRLSLACVTSRATSSGSRRA